MTRRAPRRQPREDLSQPSRWRLQHGSVVELASTGAAAPQRRAADTLATMEANGTITPAMHDAGAAFRRQFRAAALDTLRTTSLLRVDGRTGDGLTDHHLDARRKVHAALTALGGADSAAGSCVWHVVGLEQSVREWATRSGWNGKPIGHAQAQGILVAALGVLTAHYRLTPMSAAS